MCHNREQISLILLSICAYNIHIVRPQGDIKRDMSRSMILIGLFFPSLVSVQPENDLSQSCENTSISDTPCIVYFIVIINVECM